MISQLDNDLVEITFFKDASRVVYKDLLTTEKRKEYQIKTVKTCRAVKQKNGLH